MKPTEISIALSTVANTEDGRKIARILVEEKLAACVSLLPGAESFYSWKAKLHQDTEMVLLIKFATTGLDALQKRLLEIHPYDCPELIAWPIQAGHESYLQWVMQSVDHTMK
ncbi:MAG: divalent-cation tolerance protein CutA [Verrucomicrobiota bacterium]